MAKNKKLLIGLICLFTTVALFAILPKSNHSEKKRHHHVSGSKDSVKPVNFKPKPGQQACFICTAGARVYSDSLQKKCFTTLRAGDSVYLEDNEMMPIFESNVAFRIICPFHKHLVEGFIPGKCLGSGIRLKPESAENSEVFAVHYTNYKMDTEDDEKEGDAEMVLINNGKVEAKMPFKAYNTMHLDTVNKPGTFPACSFFKISYGLEACDYMNGEILVCYTNNRLDSICNNYTGFSAGNYGIYMDYLFPGDSGSHSGKIVAVQNEVLTHDENDYDKETGRIKNITTYGFDKDRFIRESGYTVVSGDTAN